MDHISVIISSYNQSATVTRIAELLLREAEVNQITLDLIIADDGSGPDEMLKLLSYIKAKDVPVRVAWQQDGGYRLAASRNNGLKLATAEVVAFIDGDCLPEPDFLKQHLKNQQKLAAPSICIGKRKFNPSAIHATPDQFMAAVVRAQIEDFDIRSRVISDFPWEGVLGRNFSLKRGSESIFFDEDLLGWGMEDLDFAIKYYRAGCRHFLYLPEATVTQEDDLSKSCSPFANPDIRHLLPAIGNALLVMYNHVEEDAIFIRLAFYLQQYLLPFKLEGAVTSYDPVCAAHFYKHHQSILPKEKSTVLAMYQNTLQLLSDYEDALPGSKRHPILRRAAISELLSSTN